MSTTNNYHISYIEAVKKADWLLPSKKEKDYHGDYCGAYAEEFKEKLESLNLGFTDDDINYLLDDFEMFFINDIGYNERIFQTPLKPQSMDAQLFLSHFKFFLPTRLMGCPIGYDILQKKGEENGFEKIGDIEEVREHITREKIQEHVKEVLSSAEYKKSIINIGDPAIAQDILWHFGLSPVYNNVEPSYVHDIVDIIERRVKEINGVYGYGDGHEFRLLPTVLTADKMSELFSGVTDEITEYVWSICKGYIDEIIGKRYVLTMNEKK